MKLQAVILILILGTVVTSVYSDEALYPLDTNADDSNGTHHASTDGTVTFMSSMGIDYAALSSDGRIIMPASLTTGLMDEGSIEIRLNFRIQNVASNAILFGSNGTGIGGFWQEAGFTILQNADSVVFTWSDGVDPDQYTWMTVATGLSELQWYSLRFYMDLATRLWQLDVDGSGMSGSLGNTLDILSFISGIESNTTTIGGVNGQTIGAFDAPVDIDHVLIRWPLQGEAAAVNNAFQLLKGDLNGTAPLTEPEQLAQEQVLLDEILFAGYDEIATDLFAYTDEYEMLNPPLYSDGVPVLNENLPLHARVLKLAQSTVFSRRFIDVTVAGMGGVVFEHHEVIPGAVPTETPRVPNAVVEVNGTYHADVAAELTDQSRVVRPTGYFLAAGDLVTIQAPAEVIDDGLSIIVGSHFRNMEPDEIGAINRFEDISAEYRLDATEITVGSPFGGLIYLRVPEGTDAGWFNLTLENAVKSPYFSWREGRHTDVASWIAEAADSGAPWADFESDKFMFTIPIENIAGITNPDAIMARWDAIMDAIRFGAGRSTTRPRAEYYTFDTRLVTPAYGAGYPQVLSIAEMNGDPRWNPLNMLDTVPHPTLLHEMGHNHLDPTMNFGPEYNACLDIEAETIVHMLYVASVSMVYGHTIESAFEDSFVTQFTFDEAAFDWIITHNFRNNLEMTFDLSVPMDDKDMVKYQHRGWARYADIARRFGWAGLNAVNGSFYTEGVPQTGTQCESRPFIVGRDEYISAATAALGENVAPLFHFWGVKPSGLLTEALEGVPKSQRSKELVETYRCDVAPENFAEYEQWHNQLYERMGYQQPRYDEYIVQFDTAFAQDIQDQFTLLLDEYGLYGPDSPGSLQGELDGSDLSLTWTDLSADESGFYVMLRRDSGPWETVATLPANSQSHELVLLDQGNYDIRVTAFNSEGLHSEICDNRANAMINIEQPIAFRIFDHGFE